MDVELSVQEPKQGNDGGAKEEGEEFPPAVAWDCEFFNNDLGAGDVDERASSDARENDGVDVTGVDHAHADDDSEGRGEGE